MTASECLDSITREPEPPEDPENAGVVVMLDLSPANDSLGLRLARRIRPRKVPTNGETELRAFADLKLIVAQLLCSNQDVPWETVEDERTGARESRAIVSFEVEDGLGPVGRFDGYIRRYGGRTEQQLVDGILAGYTAESLAPPVDPDRSYPDASES